MGEAVVGKMGLGGRKIDEERWTLRKKHRR